MPHMQPCVRARGRRSLSASTQPGAVHGRIVRHVPGAIAPLVFALVATAGSLAAAQGAATIPDILTVYRVKPEPGSVAAIAPLTVTDEFGSAAYRVGKPLALGFPAIVPGDAVHDGAAHTVARRVRTAVRLAAGPEPRTIRIVNACADQSVAVGDAVTVLVPSAVADGQHVTPLDPGVHPRDRYLCHEATADALVRGVQLTVRDRFQERRYELRRVTAVCSAASFSGSPSIATGPASGTVFPIVPRPPRNRVSRLVCYSARLARRFVQQDPVDGCGVVDNLDTPRIRPRQARRPIGAKLMVANELGTMRAVARSAVEICVPSFTFTPLNDVLPMPQRDPCVERTVPCASAAAGEIVLTSTLAADGSIRTAVEGSSVVDELDWHVTGDVAELAVPFLGALPGPLHLPSESQALPRANLVAASVLTLNAQAAEARLRTLVAEAAARVSGNHAGCDVLDDFTNYGVACSPVGACCDRHDACIDQECQAAGDSGDLSKCLGPMLSEACDACQPACPDRSHCLSTCEACRDCDGAEVDTACVETCSQCIRCVQEGCPPCRPVCLPCSDACNECHFDAMHCFATETPGESACCRRGDCGELQQCIDDGLVLTDACECLDRGIPTAGECHRGCGLTDTCAGDPTFVQAPRRARGEDATDDSTSPQGLVATIGFPQDGSLVRGQVPIWGEAGGARFASYRLEYGRGSEPTQWTEIASSSMARETKDGPPRTMVVADAAPPGNLGTWDTGLTEYVYLPTYPPEHPIDLRGEFTVRLLVTAADGGVAEDRVLIRVGTVVPNAWGGTVRSDDDVVALNVPEHALEDAFRVFRLEPGPREATPPAGSGRRLLGETYRAMPAGERFTRDATLEIRYSPDAAAPGNPAAVAIYGYDEHGPRWTHLDTVRRRPGVYSARTPRLFAGYALMASDEAGDDSPAPKQPEPRLQEAPQRIGDAGILVHDDFERGLGEWAARGDRGVEVAVQPRGDGGHAVRVSSARGVGSFGVTVCKTPFDARAYPTVEFDYRIPSDVRTNFLVRTGGRWYELGFTGGPTAVHHQRVNIGSIGTIPGIVADDRWHRARVDLAELLGNATGRSQVEEIVMANWTVAGYMKLVPGRNAPGAAYWIDDFSIRGLPGPSSVTQSSTIAVDTGARWSTDRGLPGGVDVFLDPGGAGRLSVTPIADASSPALQLAYDVRPPGSFAVYRTVLPALDLRAFGQLALDLRADSTEQLPLIGIVDGQGQERKVPIRDAWADVPAGPWRRFRVPMAALGAGLDLGNVAGVTWSFQHGAHATAAVSLRAAQFERAISHVPVENFDTREPTNLLDHGHRVLSRGDVAVTGGVVVDGVNSIYRLSYGGRIGSPSSYEDGLGFGGWITELGGIDCSACGVLRLRLRGASGGERPHVYLDDGTARWGVPLDRYGAVTTTWTEYEIPLDAFSRYDVDLTHLTSIAIVFEWSPMSGTVLLDDLAFGHPEDPSTTMAAAGTPNDGSGHR